VRCSFNLRPLPAADGLDNFDSIAGAENVSAMAGAGHDFLVDFDRDPLPRGKNPFYQLANGNAFFYGFGSSIE
jgi:hypothetical protein